MFDLDEGLEDSDFRLPPLDTITTGISAAIEIAKAAKEEDYGKAARIAGTAVVTEGAGQLCELAVPGSGPLCRIGAKALMEELLLSDNSKDNSAPLSEEELARVEELLAEIRRQLSLLSADPRTPETFKVA